jgi:hypothetical protein
MVVWAFAMVAADRFTAIVEAKLEGLRSPIAVVGATWYFNQAAEEATAAGISEVLAGKRSIAVMYRGLTLAFQVQGHREEATLRLQTMIRERVEAVPRLGFELDLFGPQRDCMAADPALAGEAIQSRSVINRLIADFPTMSYRALCVRSADVISQTGTSARVDVAIAEAWKGQEGKAS